MNLHPVLSSCPTLTKELQIQYLAWPHNWSSFCFCLSSSEPLSLFHGKLGAYIPWVRSLLLRIPFPELLASRNKCDWQAYSKNFTWVPFYLTFLNDQTVQGRACPKEWWHGSTHPLSFEVAHSLWSAYHLTVSRFTQSSNTIFLQGAPSRHRVCRCSTERN